MDIIYRGEFLLKNKSFGIEENFGAIADYTHYLFE